MSGAKMTRFFICSMFFSIAFALSWYHDSLIPWSRQSQVSHPAIFPDTLYLALSWSPVYPAFDIQEGLFYAGNNTFSLMLKTQYHKMMSNHQITFGFPILKEPKIRAGLQFHYTLSTVHGEDVLHRGSCSGGLILHPQPEWQVSLSSMHVLTFSGDSARHILEPVFSAGFSYAPISYLHIFSMFKKSVNLPWRTFVGVKWELVKPLALDLCYEVMSQHISLNLTMDFGKISANTLLGLHSYLGLTQDYMITYER